MNETRKLALWLSVLTGLLMALSIIYSNVRSGLEVDVASSDADPADIFRRYCSACHGPDGIGTEVGPRLRGRSLDVNYVRKMILTGTTKMPPIRHLHDPVLTNIASYVKELP